MTAVGERVRTLFPGLQQQVHGKPLVYLDNAATTQKPQAVLNAVQHAYVFDCANIHRGVHLLSERATAAYEAARQRVQRFLRAHEWQEIVFVRGTTEAINLVAQSFARPRLREGDEIVVSTLEHHSNIVPWQMVCEQTGTRLRVIPVSDAGELMLEEYGRLLTEKTKVVAVGHVSNALGTVNPVQVMAQMAHRVGAVVVVDGAQAVAHQAVDVQALEADFYAFSAHKMYGPTGVGVLYGRRDLLEAMPPYQGGGDMIANVTFEKTIFNSVPHKFEAGTPHIAGVIGLGAAVEFLEGLDLAAVAAHEQRLLCYGREALAQIPGLRFIGAPQHQAAVLSFVLEGVHPHDIGTILDREGIAIRTGHHCAQPAMQRFGVAATARASLAAYNTAEDLDALSRGIEQVKRMFGQ